jgi:hypothetical protein
MRVCAWYFVLGLTKLQRTKYKEQSSNLAIKCDKK